jgi:hypothetical protein
MSGVVQFPGVSKVSILHPTNMSRLKPNSAKKLFFFCKLIPSQGNFINKKVGNQKAKPTFIISVLKVVYKRWGYFF